MKSFKKFITEYAINYELTFDQVQMLIRIFDDTKLSKSEFAKIFKDSYSYSEYEYLISELKSFVKNY